MPAAILGKDSYGETGGPDMSLNSNAGLEGRLHAGAEGTHVTCPLCSVLASQFLLKPRNLNPGPHN